MINTQFKPLHDVGASTRTIISPLSKRQFIFDVYLDKTIFLQILSVFENQPIFDPLYNSYNGGNECLA